jgi:DNA ligase (NAD+)
MINDLVVIIKSGDIIPKLVRVLKERRGEGGDVQGIQFPTKCSHCNGDIVSDTVNIMCVNPTCPMILHKTMIRFANKKHFNIKHISEAIISKLQVIMNIETPLDLIRIDEVRLRKSMKELKLGDKSVVRLLKEIAKSKTVDMHVFISALNMNGIGTTFGKLVENNFDLSDPNKLFDIKVEELMKIDGIGKETAEQFCNYLKNSGDYVRNFIEELTFNKIVQVDNSKKYSGKKIGISGSFPISRSALIKKVAPYGIKIGSIAKSNDYFMVGENASMGKIDAIRKYSTELTYDELIADI